MALCRFATLYNSPLSRQLLPKPLTSSSPHYPRISTEFTGLPLAHRLSRIRTAISSGASASPSSMEAPPDGYRRNVGICLINLSKKIFSASRLDIPDSWQMLQEPGVGKLNYHWNWIEGIGEM